MEKSHNELLELERQGKIGFGIEKSHARKFLTAFSATQMEEMVGERLYVEKAAVWVFQVISPILFVASQVFIALEFKWWSLPIIPVLFVWYFIYAGVSSTGSKSILPDVVLVMIAIAIFAFSGFNLGLKIGILAFSLSMFTAKATYQMVTLFTLALIARNAKAMEFLVGKVVFIREIK